MYPEEGIKNVCCNFHGNLHGNLSNSHWKIPVKTTNANLTVALHRKTPESVGVHSLGTMNVCPKFHGNASLNTLINHINAQLRSLLSGREPIAAVLKSNSSKSKKDDTFLRSVMALYMTRGLARWQIKVWLIVIQFNQVNYDLCNNLHCLFCQQLHPFFQEC